MDSIVRWGILSTGNIAQSMAEAINKAEGCELVAVGSRTEDSAKGFAEEFSVPHRHGSYEALAMDSDVDVIYVATPHPLHAESTILCLEAGKAVLCEKPFAINADEAREMIKVAKARRVFLMEGMWVRFLPGMKKLRGWITDGKIGQPELLVVRQGFKAKRKPEWRLLNPDLGGGALLDTGVYPISFASSIMGAPTAIAGTAVIGDTGVDEQSSISLGYGNGAQSSICCSFRTSMPGEAIISGESGYITLSGWAGLDAVATLTVEGKEVDRATSPSDIHGFHFEVIHVNECVREGKVESDLMPLDETISIMETMDELRKQWGLVYPSEKV